MCKSRKGGALISALFITAIAAMIAVSLAVQQQLIIHEGELVLRADQGYLNLQSMQKAAENAVENYASQWSNTKALPAQITPLQKELTTLKINNREVSGTIENEQGKFNVNDLVYSANQANFVTLLQTLSDVSVSKQQAYTIAKSITAWMTTGADDPYYLSLHPAYRSSQTQMVNISELRLIKGITPTIYTALKHYVTALPVIITLQNQQNANPIDNTNNANPVDNTNNANPGTPPAASNSNPNVPATAKLTPVDINSVLANVLFAENPEITIEQVQKLITCRNSHGAIFPTIEAFIGECGTPNGVGTLNNITAQSSYFLVKSNEAHDGIMLDSLLVTQPQKNNTLKVVIMWQEFV